MHQRTRYSGAFPVVATVIASRALLSVPIAPKGAVRLKQEVSDYPSSAVLQAAHICRHSFKAAVRFDLKLFRL
jgi:hypothetical protein